MSDPTTLTPTPAADVRQILKARARALAAKPPALAAGQMLEVIQFRLAKERYALERCYVREVYPLKELVPLPCTPPFLAGIVNVRGQILPVIDIKKFFELPDTGITDLHMVLILRARDMEVGILADTIEGVRAIPLHAMQASLPTLTGVRAQYLKGVTDQQIIILDAPRIVADPRIIVNEEVEPEEK